MGWLFQNDPLTHQTPADYITRQFSWTDGKRGATVLATATVGNVIYAAIRNFDDEAGTSYVFAGVILFRNSRKDGFGYKDMCESMGPVECNCPDRIMRLLSPVEQIPNPGYSAQWRAAVAARKAERAQRRAGAPAALRINDVVRLAHEVTLRPGGLKAQAFRVVGQRKRTTLFAPVNHPSVLCRLTSRVLADATVERAVAEA